MLNRNLWMIWPTGYYGSYIHWLISRAEQDLSKNTIDNPFFNNGSAHAHIKNPPHQTIEFQIQAMLRNRYPTGTIYPIGIRSNVSYNSDNHNWMKSFENTFFWIMRIENEPVIINLYNGGNDYHTKLAAINVYHKEHWIIETVPDSNGYYPFKDNDKLFARNYLVENWKHIYPWHNEQLSTNTVDLYREAMNKSLQLRHEKEGWEYNKEDNWIHASGKYLYNIEISTVLQPNFIDILADIMSHCAIGNFDWDAVRHIHSEFINKQQPFVSIANNLYTQCKNLVYNPILDNNILYAALAIDTLKEEYELPESWHLLTLKEIIESLNDK